ncbi:MAG: hypothetical protein V1820_02345 [archaeon]
MMELAAAILLALVILPGFWQPGMGSSSSTREKPAPVRKVHLKIGPEKRLQAIHADREIYSASAEAPRSEVLAGLNAELEKIAPSAKYRLEIKYVPEADAYLAACLQKAVLEEARVSGGPELEEAVLALTGEKYTAPLKLAWDETGRTVLEVVGEEEERSMTPHEAVERRRRIAERIVEARQVCSKVHRAGNIYRGISARGNAYKDPDNYASAEKARGNLISLSV